MILLAVCSLLLNQAQLVNQLSFIEFQITCKWYKSKSCAAAAAFKSDWINEQVSLTHDHLFSFVLL